MRHLFVPSLRQSPNGPRATAAKPAAFTLIELLVVLVIVSVLASLSLAGLAGAPPQRAGIDKTKSTIRKLHEIILPQYDSYLSRRVTAATAPLRLAAVRLVMVQEMPDQWADVYAAASVPTQATAATRRYAQYKQTLSTGAQWSANSSKYEGAECLAMIVTRGGFSADETESFRADEIGDIDNDGAPEFWDAWGRPIGFMRWAAGFSSILQVQNATLSPDPFDPSRASTSLNYPPGTTQTDYALVPLIYSCGPSGVTDDPLATASGYSIDTSYHWLQNQPILSTRVGSPVAGELSDASVARDNITNHDLSKK